VRQTRIGNWLEQLMLKKAVMLSVSETSREKFACPRFFTLFRMTFLFLFLSFKAFGYEKVAFADIGGWAVDRHDRAFDVFRVSCRVKVATLPATELKQALKDICLQAQFEDNPRQFFEKHFTPYRVKEAGFLTGYYEPEIEGSRVRSKIYNAPLYKRPLDLVGGSDSRGKASKKTGGDYFTRGEIENGAITGRGLEIVWLKSETDGFFLSIQGSGKVRLAEGGVMRVGYDGHNGQPYTAIGRVLVTRKIAPKELVTMDYLRNYMRDETIAKELRSQNKSYIFFKEQFNNEGPIGAEQVPVTAYRSLAVDRSRYSYGTPVFVSATLPTGDMGAGEPFERLMIAQDTGSAIRGLARGDLFLGGNGSLAGEIKHESAWVVFYPNGVTPK
jgi:membrane-bound lytic murein transglycosylase A